MMANGTNIQAAKLQPSTLPQLPLALVCQDFVSGFCRRGHECTKSHDICAIINEDSGPPIPYCSPNVLSLDPRLWPQDSLPFDKDGPGCCSKYGPRHDNDHADIQHIKILPTTDEILSRRKSHVPEKSQSADHHLPCGQRRLLDVQFRQMRFDNVEPIVDSCYHATQQLTQLISSPQVLDYDDRMITPKGVRYSLFREVTFEEQIMSSRDAVMFRVSFACPKALRGQRLGPSKHLEEGMLVALVGLEADALSTTFMVIEQRQTTFAMKPRTGNDLRGQSRIPASTSFLQLANNQLLLKASVILSFADTSDTDAVRRLLYNSTGMRQEKFVIVELPNVLYAGFYWTLKDLQNISASEKDLAFIASIAPSTAGSSPEVSLPEYATLDGFAFQLDSLRKKDDATIKSSLTLKPKEVVSDRKAKDHAIEDLCRETTLDRGQARALCENLCRDFAFTQGPPGTGKTYVYF